MYTQPLVSETQSRTLPCHQDTRFPRALLGTMMPHGMGTSTDQMLPKPKRTSFVPGQAISGLGFAYAPWRSPAALQGLAGPGFSRPFITWPVAYVNPSSGKSWLNSPCSPQSQNPALSHQSPAQEEELHSVHGPICSPEGDSHLRSPPWSLQDLLAAMRPFNPEQ